jgi:2-keto-3-deoxy-galactonokinase
MIGNDDLCTLYEKALKKLGLNTTIENAEDITLNGLKQVCLGR